MRPNLIRGLVVFCAAARYLSFKMAADELCITPSAVSHQIKSLEDLIGAPLFERRTRALVLTPVGAALHSQTSPLLSSLDAVASGFLAKSRQRRVLRISVPPFFASEKLIPRLEELTGPACARVLQHVLVVQALIDEGDLRVRLHTDGYIESSIHMVAPPGQWVVVEARGGIAGIAQD